MLRSKRSTHISPKPLSLSNLKIKRGIDLSRLNERITEKLEELVSKKGEILNKIKQKRSQRPAKLQLSLTSVTDKARQEFMKGVKANFEGLERSKRSVDQQAPLAVAENAQAQVRKETFFCPTVESMKKSATLRQMPEVLQYLPEVQQEPDLTRMRKHCAECEMRRNSDPCRICGSSSSYHPGQSQYFEYVQGQPISYIPGLQNQQPQQFEQESAQPQARYVYDRHGHKYLESNGNLRLIAPTYHMQQQTTPDVLVGQTNIDAFSNILAHNQDFMGQTNHNRPGRLLEEPVKIVRDGIHFLRDIMQNANPIRSDTDGDTGSDEDLGTPHTEYRSKKHVSQGKSMYQIVPIKHGDRDGSLVVKIHPIKGQKPTKMNKFTAADLNDVKSSGDNGDKHLESLMRHENVPNVSDEDVIESQTNAPTANAQTPRLTKTIHNNKKYEILTIDGDFAAVESAEEVEHILKYIFDEREKQEIDSEKEHQSAEKDSLEALIS